MRTSLLRLSLEAVGGGHDDGGIAVDDGSTTAIPSTFYVKSEYCINDLLIFSIIKMYKPGVVTFVEVALPGELVLQGVRATHNPGSSSAAA